MYIYHKLLTVARKAKCKFFPDNSFLKINTDINAVDYASKIIYDGIISGKPFMVARYGSTELTTIMNYLGVINGCKNPYRYIFKDGLQWWWNDSLIEQMQRWSGFFPPTKEDVGRFCQLVLDDSKYIDVLGCWTYGEKKMLPYISKECSFVHLRLLEPFWSKNPWTKALEGKKVLVVHPFAKTILEQYEKRDKLFSNKDILSEFADLEVVKAVQSLGKADSRFSDWFDALQWMERVIDTHDYDVCLIGCGAYGLPLAAHVKRQGKQAIHLGGALQLLFGIIGKRWEDPMYGVDVWKIPEGSYTSLINDYWVRPDSSEQANNTKSVEGGCYW